MLVTVAITLEIYKNIFVIMVLYYLCFIKMQNIEDTVISKFTWKAGSAGERKFYVDVKD